MKKPLRFLLVRRLFLTLFYFVYIIWRSLIYKVVKPVGIKQISVCPPGDKGRIFGIIVGEIVFRNIYRFALALIAEILVGKGARVIFRMTRYENLSSLFGHSGIHARFLGGGQNPKLGYSLYILGFNGGMAGLRHHKGIVKAPKQYRTLIISLSRENPEQLFRKRVFFYSKMVVKPCLSAPADMEGTVNMGLAPLHYFAELVPVLNLFKSQLFNRRTRYYHTVKGAVFNILEGFIKCKKMLR